MSVIRKGIKTISDEEKQMICCLANLPLKYAKRSSQTRKKIAKGNNKGRLETSKKKEKC